MARELSRAAIVCDEDPAIRAVIVTVWSHVLRGGDLGEFAEAGTHGRHSSELAGDLHMGISRLTR